jgi:hypothetical protein
MIHGCIGGTGSTGELACLDDFSSTLLHGGDEALLNPLVVNELGDLLAMHGGHVEVGNHGGAVVAQDGELLYV